MPHIRSIKINEHSFVEVWKITESVAELSELVLPSKEDQQTIDTFRLEKRKLEFLASRQLIKAKIKDYPQIKYLPSGKPILENSDFNISITHTKGFAAVIFSKHNSPGIDIEYPSQRIIKIADRFISPQEHRYISKEKLIPYYTVIWCTKEALYKIIDQQGVIFNHDFVCDAFDIETDNTISSWYKTKDSKSKHYFSFIITPEYYLVYSI